MRPIFTMALMTLSACAARSRGSHIDPSLLRLPLGESPIELSDVEEAAEQMTADLLASEALTDFEGTPRIAVMPVENRSGFLMNQDVFTTLITEALMRENAGHVAAVSVAPADFYLVGRLERLATSRSVPDPERTAVRFDLTDQMGLVTWTRMYELQREGAWAAL
jgi:hypothetical protein